MGMGLDFVDMVHTMFGNAHSRVMVNAELIDSIPLRRSIRQGCPLAHLLYAIAVDGLN